MFSPVLNFVDMISNLTATPHNGSSLAAYGSAIATVARYCSPLNPPQALLETLRKNSKALFDLRAEFVREASKLQIVSFYETKMTRIGIWKKMVRQTASLA